MTLIKFQNPKMKSYFETDTLFPGFGNSLDNFFKTNYHYGERVAAVNVVENDNEYQLSILVPGFKKEEIKVALEKQVLTVKGEIKHAAAEENERFTRKEFTLNTFKRSFTLPEHADVNAMSAKHENGILLITLPKKQEVKKDEIREIEIL
jgi:HSP20 family protein